MSEVENSTATPLKKLPSVRTVAFASLWLVLAVSCGDTGTTPGFPPGTGASGGSAGSSGTGGMGGGTGGTGGSGGVATKSICTADTPPSSNLCETDLNCALPGYVCVDSGCKTDEGAAIKQCQLSRGPSCVEKNDCSITNPDAYACVAVSVGGGGKSCVRVDPGCDTATETYDCPPGFSCEGGACVDRRIPCGGPVGCPKSHTCTTMPTVSRYCIRTHRTCRVDDDCLQPLAAGSFCADVDNDGTKECVGDLEGKGCVNSACVTASAPVCETGGDETVATCGGYGLCLSDSDCDVDSGFSCVGLWQDGRKECVRTGGTCDQVTDCDPQQVCAAPRNGGPPSCQSGSGP
jgi:hypothetical protein